MVVNDGLGHQECRSGIRCGNGHVQQIGLGNDSGGNGCAEGCAQRRLDILAHYGAVDQFRKHAGHLRGGRKVAVNRGGAGTGGHHKGNLGLVLGSVLHIGHNIGAHTHSQGHQHNDQPVLQGVLEHQNGVKGQQAVEGIFHFIVIHVHSSTTTISLE